MSAHAQQFRGTSRFEVVSQVGQGGTGFVYEVVDHERNSRLALKTLRTPDAEAILLLKNEFRAIQDMSHPNLVVPKELFEENGQWFFTMDYVEGTDVLAYVRRSPPGASDASGEREIHVEGAPLDGRGVLDEARLRSALRQLATGLCALHASHKVHRDIKPSNILVTPEGRVLILDFGIVADAARLKRSEEDFLVGTVHYMAPEQAAGEAVTPAADWYAVGGMLYQALTGQLPFNGTMQEVLGRKMIAEPPAPSAVAEGVPADLSQLCVDLLRTDPSKRPEGFEILERLGVSATDESSHAARAAMFIGRKAELRVLEEAFAAAKTDAVTLLVEGESGVGKSFLVREFTARAAERSQAVVFRGRCYERESVPYKAVDSLIDDLSQFLSSLPEDEAAALLPPQAGLLRKLFPVLETVHVVHEARITHIDVPNPQEVRARVFDVLRELLQNIARRNRLVLVIDDLQWADADSLALLSEVLRPPSAPPLLLLASIRIGTEKARRGETIGERLARLPGDVRHIRLDALPTADARDLIRQLIGTAEGAAAEREIDAILAEAKGHPLFIDELVRHRATHREVAAPSRLDEALWERASRLSPAARKLLELVAIAGVPLQQQVVAHAAALDFGQVFDSVSALRSAHFVRTSGVYRKDTVEAYHDRVRESVLRHIDDATRKEWHGRLAVALEQSADFDPEMLATHWSGAGNATRAREYAIRAADQAASALAFDHAAALYRMALDLGSKDASKGLKVKLAEALTNAGRGAEAARVYVDAAGGASTNEALDLRRRAAEEFMCSGHFDEGARTFDDVLVAMGIRTPRTPMGIIFSLLVFSVVLAIRGFKYVARPAEAIDPRDLLIIDCLYSAGSGFGMSDHIRGKEFQLRTLLHALKTGEKSRVVRALAFYGAANASTGGPGYARTMKMHGVVEKMAAEVKQPFTDAMTLLVAAYAYQFTGQWTRARDTFLTAEAILRDQCVGVSYELASVRTLLLRTYASLGDIDELARRAETAVREADQRGDLYTAINLRCSATSFLGLLRDDLAGAQRELDWAGEHLAKGGFHVQHYFHLASQSNAWLYAGDAERCHAEMTAKWPAVKRSMLLRVQAVRIMVNDVRARTAIVLATRSGADRAHRKAAEGYVRAIEREDMEWARPHARMLRASLAHLDGDARGALSHLEAAEAEFAAADMQLLAQIARRRRGLLMNGDGGAALRTTADAWLTARGIQSPAKLTALYSPGFAAERD
jgi:tRNA A-37 threonylcarbamoyl transferase component Bud32/tetratricopeptide (TPR) repeat protein/type II secretory pathway predicted ATPase ExeA